MCSGQTGRLNGASAHVCYRERAHTQTTCSQGNGFIVSSLISRPDWNQRTDQDPRCEITTYDHTNESYRH